MEWRHSGSPRRKNCECKNPMENLLLPFFGVKMAFSSLSSKGQTINAKYYSSLLVRLKDILKEKHRGKVNKGCLVRVRQCPGTPGTCNPEETGLPGLLMSCSPTLFSGSDPIGLSPVPWTEKTIERSPFFFRHGGHCRRGELVGRTTFCFFGGGGLQKVEQRAKKFIELNGEYVE